MKTRRKITRKKIHSLTDRFLLVSDTRDAWKDKEYGFAVFGFIISFAGLVFITVLGIGIFHVIWRMATNLQLKPVLIGAGITGGIAAVLFGFFYLFVIWNPGAEED